MKKTMLAVASAAIISKGPSPVAFIFMCLAWYLLVVAATIYVPFLGLALWALSLAFFIAADRI